MNSSAWMLLAVYLAVLLVLAWPLARMIDAVMSGRFALGQRLEAPLFKLAGVKPQHESGWLRYGLGLLLFNVLGFLAVYVLQRYQSVLPLNPQAFGDVSADSSFNTAISFVTNTNWQGYVGGFANICADVIIYLLFFGMLRLVIFQFQTPMVFPTEKS